MVINYFNVDLNTVSSPQRNGIMHVELMSATNCFRVKVINDL